MIKQNRNYDHLPPIFRAEYDAYVEWLIGHQQVKPITIENRIAGHVLRYLRFLNESKEYDTSELATAKDAVDFLTHIPSGKRSSAQKFRQSLRSFMKWQCVQEVISADEIVKFDMVKPSVRFQVSPPPRALNTTEAVTIFANIEAKYPYSARSVDRLVRGIHLGRQISTELRRSMVGTQFRCLMMLALETGLRRSELYGLVLNDIDPLNESIYVRPEISKNNKPRTVPYPEPLKPYVKKWLSHRKLMVGDDHEHVWVSMSGDWGRPISAEGFRKWIEQIFDGDIDAGWHILRKTFATVRYNLGWDLGKISKMLGHDSIKTTEIYLGVEVQDILEEHKVFEDVVSGTFSGYAERGIKWAERWKAKAAEGQPDLATSTESEQAV